MLIHFCGLDSLFGKKDDGGAQGISWIIQIGFAEPADGMMFVGCEDDLIGFGAGKIHKANMFMIAWRDIVDIHIGWSNEELGSWGCKVGFGADDFDIQAAFFFGFAIHGLFRIFV